MAFKFLNDINLFFFSPLNEKITMNGIQTPRDVQFKILERMKHVLRLTNNSDRDIIKHMYSRPYGTTAAIYRLLELENERKLPVLRNITNTMNNENRSLTRKPTMALNGPKSILKLKRTFPHQQQQTKIFEPSKLKQVKTVRFLDSESDSKKVADDLIFSKRPRMIRNLLRM